MSSRRLIVRRAQLAPQAWRFPVGKAVLAGFAVASVVAFRAHNAGDAAHATTVRSQPRRASMRMPSTELVAENRGSIPSLSRVNIVEPPVEVKPLFEEQGARAQAEQTTTLKYNARDRATGKQTAAAMTAVLMHGTDEPVELDVVDKGDGEIEVPVTPHGIGRFDVVLKADGVPVASTRIGVAGSAGGGTYPDDYMDFTADMRMGRSRPGQRGSRRR